MTSLSPGGAARRCPALLCRLLVLALAVLGVRPALAQSGDQALPTVTRALAIQNARIVQAPGRVIERGTVVVRNGLIVDVGTDVAIPYDAQVIAGDSLTVYAGFIDGLSNVGIPQPKAGEDRPRVENRGNPSNELAGIQPERAAPDFLDASDKSIDALRKVGFTAAHVVPRGRLLPGTGAIILLAGDNAGSMVLADRTSLMAEFAGARGVYPSTNMAVMAKMRQLYREAQRRQMIEQRYADAPAGMERPAYDPVHAAFYPVIDGDMPVFFYADEALAIHRALTLEEQLGFNMALAGLSQGFAVVETLKEADAPLFLTLDLPEEIKKDKPKADSTAADTTRAMTPEVPDSPFMSDYRTQSYKDVEGEEKNLKARNVLMRDEFVATAARLHEAGLRFGFTTREAKATEIQKNLRAMVAAGLSEDAALAALTTDAATLLGLSAQLGTVEPGKIANLVVTDGSYFDEKGKVRHVVVDGRMFDYEAAPAAPANGGAVAAAGAWSYTITTPQGAVGGSLSISGSPGSLSGTLTNDMMPGTTPLEDLELNGSSLSFSFNAGEMGRITAAVTLSGDTFSGTITVPGMGDAPISGTRDPSRR